MKNKRFFILILIAMICCTLLFSVGCGCGKDNNNDGTNEQGQDSPVPEKDNTSPVITLNSAEREFSVNVEEALVLPVATAYDKEDGDVSKNIIIIPASGSKFCKIVDGKFYSEVGGRHEIFYVAIDSVGNETFESIYVDVRAKTAEKSLENGWENDLSILNTSQGVFFENFEKGPDAPLTKSAWNNHYTLTGGEDAISGNSLIIDYSKVNGNQSNKVYLSNTAHYLSSGIWSVSFDLKSLSDNSLDDLYFAYSLVGGNDVVSYGRKLSDNGFIKGQTVNVSLKMAIEVEGKNIGNYVFYIYRTNAVPDKSVVVLDNFKLMREDLPFKTYSPTINELENGFTYDWTENKYATLGTLERISEIDNVSVRTQLTESEYFGESAMVLSQSARLNGITANINPDYFEPNKVYTITIPYYSETAIKGYLSVVNEKANNRTIGFNIFNKTGEVGIAEIRYIIGIGEQEFIIYTPDHWDNLYIGNISIRRSDRIDEKVDTLLYSPTAQELKDGYTFDFTSKVISLNSEWTDVEYYKVGNDLPDSDVILPTEYFTRTYVLRLGGYYTTEIKSFENGIAEENTYTVRMKVYCDNFNPEEYHLLVLDANKEQINKENTSFNCVSLGNNMYELSATVEGNRRAKSIAFYSVSYYKFYVSEIMLKADAAGKMTLEQAESGFVSRGDKNLLLSGGTWVDESPVGFITENEWLYHIALQDSVYNMRMDFASGVECICNEDYYNKLVIKGYIASGSTNDIVLLLMDGNTQVHAPYFPVVSTDGQITTLTFYFLGDTRANNIIVFRKPAASIEMYVEEIDFNTETYDRSAVMNTSVTQIIMPKLCDVYDYNYGGQCESIIIIDRGRVAVIDAGDAGNSTRTTDASKFILTNTLYGLGVTKIDVLILSHPHGDHYGAMSYLMSHFDIGAFVYKQGDYENKATGSTTMQSAIDTLISIAEAKVNSDSSSVNLVDVDFGEELILFDRDGDGIVDVSDNDSYFKFYYNKRIFEEGESADGNYFSIVSTFTVGDTGVLYAPGDYADEYTDYYANVYEEDVLNAASKFLIYQPAHHGQSTPYNSAAIIREIAPKYILICNTEENYTSKAMYAGTISRIETYAGDADTYFADGGAVFTVDVSSKTITADDSYKHWQGNDDFMPITVFTAQDVGNEQNISGITLDTNKYSVNTDKMSYMDIEYVNVIEGVDQTGDVRYLHATANNMPSTFALTSFADVFTEGKCYKLTLVMTQVTSTSYFEMLFQNKTGSGVMAPQALTKTKIDDNWFAYTVYFKATADLSYLCLFDYNKNDYDNGLKTEFYLKSINLIMIEENAMPTRWDFNSADLVITEGSTSVENAIITVGASEVENVPQGTYYHIDLETYENNIINNFNGQFKEGHAYTVYVKGYIKSYSSSLNLMFFDNLFYGVSNVKTGIYKDGEMSVIVGTVVAAQDSYRLGLFVDAESHIEMYVAFIEIIDMGETTVINLANDNAKVDFSENQTTSFIYDYGYSSAYLDYDEDNVKGLHVSSSAGAHTILGFTNNALGLSEGTKYELTIVGTELGQIRQSSDHPDQYSGNLVSILGTNGYSFDVYEIENGKYLYRVVFIATTSDVLIFNMTSCPAKDFFVYSVQLRELSIQSVSAAEIAESGGKTITAKDLYYTSGDFADTGFDGEKIHVKASDMRGADLKIRSFNGAITEGNCYKVEIVLTGDSVVSNSFNLIFSGVVNPIALDRKTVGENTVYGTTFKAVSDTEYIGIRMVGYDSDVLAEICILSVNVELIEESLVSVSKKVDGEDIRGARGEVVSLSDGDVSGVPAGNYYLVNLSYGGNTQILNFDGIFEQGHSYRVSVSGYRKSASTLYAFTYSEGSGGDNGIFSFSSNGDGSITLTATIAVSGTAANYKSLGLFNGGGTELMYVSSVEVTTYYTVTFKVDGNNYGEPKLLKHGDKIEMPKTPSKQDATNDYSFDGWFLGDTKWDFDSDTVEFDVELNAKWKIGATYTEDFLPSGIN